MPGTCHQPLQAGALYIQEAMSFPSLLHSVKQLACNARWGVGHVHSYVLRYELRLVPPDPCTGILNNLHVALLRNS